MAEITKDGATGKTLSEYKEEIESSYLAIDSDWDIDPATPDGMTIAIFAEMLANLDEGVINAYQSVDPDSSVGQQLDRIAQFSGITRKAETFSTAAVTFSGEPLKTIPSGTLIRHRLTSTLWATDADSSTDANGTVTVNVTCTTGGIQSAVEGTLTIIASVVGGITSVTNANAASPGTAEESDSVFRIRRSETVALPGNNQIDTIYSSLIDITDVKQVRIYENDESEIDSNGLSSHSMAIFIDGGSHDEIVSTIAANKNPGCGLNRYNEAIPNGVNDNALTPLSQNVKVTYFRPEYLSVYVIVNIVSDTLTDSDKEAIKNEIVEYSLYGFIDSTKFSKRGFRIGETIAAGRLYTPANSIVGHNYFVESIMIGTSSDNISSATIPTAFYQLGVFDADNIEVNIEPSG